ncbi:MAG: hypothetical protein ACRCVJ_00420 [Clostridium sp.]
MKKIANIMVSIILVTIAYDCNRCDYYAEVDSTESKTTCKSS